MASASAPARRASVSAPYSASAAFAAIRQAQRLPLSTVDT